MAWASMGTHSKWLGFPGFTGLWQVKVGIDWNKTGSNSRRADNLARYCGEKMFVFCSCRGTRLRKIWWKKGQTAYKPGSVPAPCGAMDDHSSGTSVAGRLARPTRMASAKTPFAAPVSRPAGHPYAVLLPVGFALPPPLPAARCALTTPFHPYRPRPPGLSPKEPAGSAVCSLWHCPWGRPRRALPGTVFPWSPDFPRTRRYRRPRGHPAVWRWDK